jgi:hypothetical protein
VVGDFTTTWLPVFSGRAKMGRHSLCDVLLLWMKLEIVGQSKPFTCGVFGLRPCKVCHMEGLGTCYV